MKEIRETKEAAEIRDKILDLTDSMLFSLEHAALRINEGARRQTLIMMTETMEGFAKIEETLPLIQPENHGEMDKLTLEVRNGFAAVVQGYEKEDDRFLLEVLVLQLIPAFKSWQENMRQHSPQTVL